MSIPARWCALGGPPARPRRPTTARPPPEPKLPEPAPGDAVVFVPTTDPRRSPRDPRDPRDPGPVCLSRERAERTRVGERGGGVHPPAGGGVHPPRRPAREPAAVREGGRRDGSERGRVDSRGHGGGPDGGSIACLLHGEREIGRERPEGIWSRRGPDRRGRGGGGGAPRRRRGRPTPISECPRWAPPTRHHPARPRPTPRRKSPTRARGLATRWTARRGRARARRRGAEAPRTQTRRAPSPTRATRRLDPTRPRFPPPPPPLLPRVVLPPRGLVARRVSSVPSRRDRRFRRRHDPGAENGVRECDPRMPRKRTPRTRPRGTIRARTQSRDLSGRRRAAGPPGPAPAPALAAPVAR